MRRKKGQVLHVESDRNYKYLSVVNSIKKNTFQNLQERKERLGLLKMQYFEQSKLHPDDCENSAVLSHRSGDRQVDQEREILFEFLKAKT